MSRVVDEKLLFSKTILERLDYEAEADGDAGDSVNAFWWAVTQANDGQIIAQSNYDMSRARHEVIASDVIHPTADQVGYAIEAMKTLNKECDHNGFWIVGFTHPPSFANLISTTPDYHWRRMIKIWVDQHGDPGFTADNIDPFWMIAGLGPEHLIEQSEESWKQWKHLMRDDMDYKENQLVYKAIERERKAS